MAWLIASESYTSPFTRIKQWPMKGGWGGPMKGRPMKGRDREAWHAQVH